MEGIPSLPSSGPLRVLAVSGSISLFLFAWAAVAALRSDAPWRAIWPFGIFVLALATGFLGQISANVHTLAVLLTAGTAIASLFRTRGTTRGLSAGGLVAWTVAVASARALFH